MTRAWTVLGIDPGEQGSAALILAHAGCDRPQLEELVDASNRAAVRGLATAADLVVIEAQQASPQMGRSSAFNLGRGYGRLLEAVEAGAAEGGAEVAVVFPTVWRGSYGLAGGKSGKVAGLELARELVPAGADQGEELERHDQADAVLLAWWGWRKRLLARAMQELHPGLSEP